LAANKVRSFLMMLAVTFSGGLLGLLVGILGVNIMVMVTNTPAAVSWGYLRWLLDLLLSWGALLAFSLPASCSVGSC